MSWPALPSRKPWKTWGLTLVGPSATLDTTHIKRPRPVCNHRTGPRSKVHAHRTPDGDASRASGARQGDPRLSASEQGTRSATRIGPDSAGRMRAACVLGWGEPRPMGAADRVHRYRSRG